jgi:para-nitrobenzyl esterase
LKKTANEEFGPNAAEFLRLFPGDSGAAAARSAAEFAADRFTVFSTWAWLDAQARTGHQPVYRYRFDRAPPTDVLGRKRGSFHSAEIPYVFGTFDSEPQVPWTAEDRTLGELLHGYWTNFARTGNPNGPGLPRWPDYAAVSAWQVLHLDGVPAARPDAFRSRYRFLAHEWEK